MRPSHVLDVGVAAWLSADRPDSAPVREEVVGVRRHVTDPLVIPSCWAVVLQPVVDEHATEYRQDVLYIRAQTGGMLLSLLLGVPLLIRPSA